MKMAAVTMHGDNGWIGIEISIRGLTEQLDLIDAKRLHRVLAMSIRMLEKAQAERDAK